MQWCQWILILRKMYWDWGFVKAEYNVLDWKPKMMIESVNQYNSSISKEENHNPISKSISNTNSLVFGYQFQISVLKLFIFICTKICNFQQAKKNL